MAVTKIRKNYTISAVNITSIEKMSKQKKMAHSALVDFILTQYFNQEMLTQELIYKQLSLTNKGVNQNKKLMEMTFEVMTIFLESYFARAPEIPEETRITAAKQAHNKVRAIIEKAAQNLNQGTTLIPAENKVDPDEIMDAAKDILGEH